MVSSKKDQDNHAQGLIDDSLTDYNKLGNRANTVLGENKFKFEPVFSKTQEVGKIGFAFDHAIKNFGMYSFMVFAVCILLDFLIIIIIHVLPASENGNDENDDYEEGGHKRIGPIVLP